MTRTCAGRSTMPSTATRSWQFAYEGTTLQVAPLLPGLPAAGPLVDMAIDAGTYDLDQLWTHDPAQGQGDL